MILLVLIIRFTVIINLINNIVIVLLLLSVLLFLLVGDLRLTSLYEIVRASQLEGMCSLPGSI